MVHETTAAVEQVPRAKKKGLPSEAPFCGTEPGVSIAGATSTSYGVAPSVRARWPSFPVTMRTSRPEVGVLVKTS